MLSTPLKSLAAAAALSVAQGIAAAQGPPAIDPSHTVFYPPPAEADWENWRQALVNWRQQTLDVLQYDDSLYRRPDLLWTQGNFACGFVMLWDEMLWDWRTRRFTPDKLLDDARRRFGGFDSVVLWHAYPRIGFDGRNQFDFYRDMPGGLAGMRELVGQFHNHGVQVFIDYNPWDTGTRREERDDLVMLTEMVAAMDADGIFLDTLHRGADRFQELLDRARPGVALESELALDVAGIADHPLSWGQWNKGIQPDGPPGVARNKWFEPRHNHHVVSRWATDHTPELHLAWMNGTGMLVWENVFGQPRIWSPRDQSILRAMLPVQRHFADCFNGPWTPLVPTKHPDVYASLWQNGKVRLWTLVNRSESAIDGDLLVVEHRPEDRYCDLVRGETLQPALEEGRASLKGKIPPRGIGAILAAPVETDFSELLDHQTETNRAADFSPATGVPEEELFPVRPTQKYTPATLPAGMLAVPATRFTMRVTFTSRECGTYQTPLNRDVQLPAFAIDETPVTNAQYAEFLERSGYRPRSGENFLKHWNGGRPPRGAEDHPVVYVGLEDARAYARWAGKRLPTEEEWQLAAGGPAGSAFPWGEQFDPTRCNHGQSGGLTPVRNFPDGRSPLGACDMCGNAWEWTESERHDGRTRFCVLKGGSYFKAEGSRWYSDGGPQPTHHAAKFLLMWPGLDRCGTIGFRCAADMADDSSHVR